MVTWRKLEVTSKIEKDCQGAGLEDGEICGNVELLGRASEGRTGFPWLCSAWHLGDETPPVVTS